MRRFQVTYDVTYKSEHNRYRLLIKGNKISLTCYKYLSSDIIGKQYYECFCNDDHFISQALVVYRNCELSEFLAYLASGYRLNKYYRHRTIKTEFSRCPIPFNIDIFVNIHRSGEA